MIGIFGKNCGTRASTPPCWGGDTGLPCPAPLRRRRPSPASPRLTYLYYGKEIFSAAAPLCGGCWPGPKATGKNAGGEPGHRKFGRPSLGRVHVLSTDAASSSARDTPEGCRQVVFRSLAGARLGGCFWRADEVNMANAPLAGAHATLDSAASSTYSGYRRIQLDDVPPASSASMTTATPARGS